MAIKSHTIPRFYLEQFAAPRKKKAGLVWVYQKGKEPLHRSTTSQGYEKGYFKVAHDDGAEDESMEAVLAKLEGECLDSLVTARSPLCALSLIRPKLAYYVAMLSQRSTVRRKFSARNWAKLTEPYSSLASNEEYLRDAAQHFTKRTGRTFTREEIAESIGRVAEKFSDEDFTRSTAVKNLLMFVELGKQELLKKYWQVWDAPEGAEFVTADNPVVTFVRLFSAGQELWHPGYGWGYKGVVIAFPLSPTACLTMTDSPRSERRTVDDDTVVRMNEMLICCCDRFVYARTLSARISETVGQWANTSIPGENAFMGRAVDRQVVEDHLRKTMQIERRG